MIDLLAKYQNQMSLFLLFFMLVQLIYLVLLENMQRINWMYFCVNNVHIWLTKYQKDIICNKTQLQG